MKPTLFRIVPFLFVIILSVHTCYSQVRMINTSLADTSQHILFNWIENEIKVDGNRNENYRLVSKRNASITKVSALNFRVQCNSMAVDTLQLFEKNKLILSQVFRVDSLPKYILTLGALKEGPATKDQIIINKRLQVYFPHCVCPIAFYVVSYKLEFVSRNLASYEKYMIVDGNALDDKAIALVRRLSSKDQLIFRDVHLMDIGSRARSIDTFVLTIK